MEIVSKQMKKKLKRLKKKYYGEVGAKDVTWTQLMVNVIFGLLCLIVFVIILWFILGLVLYFLMYPDGDIFFLFKEFYGIYQFIIWIIDSFGIMGIIVVAIFLKTSLWVVGNNRNRL